MGEETLALIISVAVGLLLLLTARLLKRGNYDAQNFNWKKFEAEQIRNGGQGIHNIRDYVMRTTRRRNSKLPEQLVKNAASFYGNKNNFALAFDTNILIDYPSILDEIIVSGNIRLLISGKVRNELNGAKDDRSKEDDVRNAARYALKSISDLHKQGLITYLHFSRDIVPDDMDPNNADDLIISSYIEWTKKNRASKVLFISSDTDARFTARMTNLEVLEPDWQESKERISNTSPIGRRKGKVRPGYSFKFAAIISFSLALGLLFTVPVLVGNATVNTVLPFIFEQDTDGSKDVNKKIKFSMMRPLTLNETEYYIKSEYDNIYKGQYKKDLGGMAIVDVKVDNIGYTFNYANIIFGTWFNSRKIGDFENEYKAVLKMNDEIVNETNISFDKRASKDVIQFKSIDTKIKFTGVNQHLAVVIDMKDLTELNDSAVILFVHKVTGDLAFELPVKVLEVGEEALKQDD